MGQGLGARVIKDPLSIPQNLSCRSLTRIGFGALENLDFMGL